MSKEQSGPAFPVSHATEKGPQDGASLREYAAIQLRVPDSGLPWLDDMIRESLRDDFAKEAFSAVVQEALAFDDTDWSKVAKEARSAASAMLAERSKK